jgi:hypothetical protein
MTNNQKQQMLSDALFEASRGEFDGIVTEELGDVPDKYRGVVLHVNDHGNVTLYKRFKNNTYREIVSRV